MCLSDASNAGLWILAWRFVGRKAQGALSGRRSGRRRRALFLATSLAYSRLGAPKGSCKESKKSINRAKGGRHKP